MYKWRRRRHRSSRPDTIWRLKVPSINRKSVGWRGVRREIPMPPYYSPPFPSLGHFLPPLPTNLLFSIPTIFLTPSPSFLLSINSFSPGRRLHSYFYACTFVSVCVHFFHTDPRRPTLVGRPRHKNRTKKLWQFVSQRV